MRTRISKNRIPSGGRTNAVFILLALTLGGGIPSLLFRPLSILPSLDLSSSSSLPPLINKPLPSPHSLPSELGVIAVGVSGEAHKLAKLCGRQTYFGVFYA